MFIKANNLVYRSALSDLFIGMINRNETYTKVIFKREIVFLYDIHFTIYILHSILHLL